MRLLRLLLVGLSFAAALAARPIRVRMNGYMTLNPMLLAREDEVPVVELVFDRLVTLNEKGEFIPQLLEGWTLSPDKREAVLTLRPGLTWQDGSPLEAEDVVATWRMMSLPQVVKVFDAGGTRTLDSLTAEGPRRVRIRLKEPRATLLADLYNLIPVPRKLYKMGAEPLKAPVNFAPVGSGPYRVVPGATGRRLELKRWDEYRGAHPGRADGFLFQTWLPKGVKGEFSSGWFDFDPTSWMSAYLLRKGALGRVPYKVDARPQAGFRALWLNCDPARSVLADVRLRQALAELVPWERILKHLQIQPETMALSLWPPQSWAHDPTPQPLPKPERAAQILDEAGWRAGADGIRRNAQGQELRLTLSSDEPDGSARNSLTNLFVEQARRIGIRMAPTYTGSDEVAAAAAKGEGDIWVFNWVTSLDPDAESTLFTSEGIPTQANVSRYRNPEVDRLFSQGRHEMDPEIRKWIYRRIAALIRQERPLIPINYRVNFTAVRQDLEGVVFNASGAHYGFYPSMRGWRLKVE